MAGMAISHHMAWGWTRQAAAKLRRHWDEEKRALFDDGEVPGGSRIQEAGSFGQPFSARAEEAFSIISAKEVFGISDEAGNPPGMIDDWLATISNQLDYFRGRLRISEVAKEPALAAKYWGSVASETPAFRAS